MDLLPLRFAYLLPILGLVLVYAWIFLSRKDLRRKMLRTSLWGAAVGPISQWWYLKDYWRPEHTLTGTFGGVFEDVLFGFVIVGATAGLVNVLSKTRSVAVQGDRPLWWRYLVGLSIVIGSLVFFTNVLGLNSMHASPIGFFLLAIFIWWQRPDLARFSLISGLFWLTFTIFGYSLIMWVWPDFFARWWLWENISKITVWRIPVEELLWFSSVGLAGSVAHEWRQGLKFVSLNVSK